MKKLFLLVAVVAMFLPGCTKLEESIDALADRVDKLEQSIPTIEEQITAIQASITSLEEVDIQLKEKIMALEASDKASAEVITALKAKDTELDQKIKTLQDYVESLNKSTKDWVTTTFATLEQFNSLSTEVANLKTLLEQYKNNAATNLSNAISALETSMKSWIGEQLAGYYTIAEVDAKIATLQSALTDGDSALQEQLNELKEQLITTKNEITEAYQKAIKEAIETNNGVIEGKIANEVATINKRIDDEISAINAKIATLEAQVNQNTENIAKLLARIQSITYIPTYDDGKATVKHMNRASQVTLDFKVSPKECVVELAKVWENSVKVEVVYTQTRAISFVDMPIVKFDADTENGIISVIASGENLSEEVFTGTQSTSVSLVISDGNSSVASEYIPMVATEVELKDLLVPSNEIWYTSTDGEIVEPTRSDAFDVRVISNTYKDGMGILKFDGNVTDIYLYAFCNQETQVGAENLETIKFPNGLAEIGEYAFCNCTSLAEVLVPPTLTRSNAQAFEGCTNLIRVDISDLSAWCKIAFPGTINGFPLYNDAKLYLDSVEVTNLDIPSDIDIIKGGAFCGCSSIISIDIPSNVTEIRSHAFYRCKNLAIVYCKPTIPPSITLGSPSGKWLAFSSNAKGRMIYVPRESVKAYKSADGWKDYADYIVGYDF